MTSTRLPEIELVHNQGQNTTTSNQRGYQQIKGDEIFQ